MSRVASSRAAAAAVVAMLLLPTAGAATEQTYVSQSLWSAKHLGAVDKLLYSGRPVWAAKPTGDHVRVGLVSTGVDPSHPDLEDAVVAWHDFVELKPEPYDDHGYGTFLAGIVAARGHFQPSPFASYWLTGARGVAPEADLVVAKAVSSTEQATDRDVARALLWMLDPDGDGDAADRVHLVLLPTVVERPRLPAGQATQLPFGERTKEAVMDLTAKGVVVVVSAGNDRQKLDPPGDLPAALTVGAVDRHGLAADFNARGLGLDILAPGALVGPWPKALDTSDFSDDAYASVVGTGVASAFVAGVVALMVDADPALRETAESAAGIRRVNALQATLKGSATPVDAGEKEPIGMVVAAGAVEKVDQGADGLDWRIVGVGASLAALLVFLFARRAARAAAKARAAKSDD